MTLKAVFFDHDGTLVDSEPVHFQIWQQVLDRHAFRLSEAQYRDHYAGVPTLPSAQDMVQRFGLAADADELAAAKYRMTDAYLSCQAFTLMPQARAVIDAIAGLDLTMAVVTGARRNGVDATLRANSLEARIATVVGAEDVVRGKPAPDCYLLAMERLGLQPDQCVAIEDTEHGVNAAAAAGLACIAIPTPMSAHHDFSRASDVLSDLASAQAWIAQRCAPLSQQHRR